MSTVGCSVSWCWWCYRAIYIPRALKIWLMKYITPSQFQSWAHTSFAYTTTSSKQTLSLLTRSLFSHPTYIWTMDFGVLWDYSEVKVTVAELYGVVNTYFLKYLLANLVKTYIFFCLSNRIFIPFIYVFDWWIEIFIIVE